MLREPPHYAAVPWWAWRRRAARVRFLERLARTEFRVSVDGVPGMAATFEMSYRGVLRDATVDIVRGLAFTDLAHIGIAGPDGPDDDHAVHRCITLSLRMPVDVEL